jgi:hypothetical protein
MTGEQARPVRVRLSGQPGDVEAVARLLRASGQGAGVEVLFQTGPRPNRLDPGVRIYLGLLVTGGDPS